MTYPTLETFQPAFLAYKRYLNDVRTSNEAIPLPIALERPGGSISRFEALVCTDGALWLERTKRHLERLVKFLLWAYGASTLYIGGSAVLVSFIRSVYSPEGARKFDYAFMSRVYGKPFEVIACGLDEVPFPTPSVLAVSRQLKGCRIGFDLGASDLKVAAVRDGEPIFSTEMEWNPRDQADPDYHKTFIRKALRLAASHLPRVDAIGGSSAGIIINNQPRVASLFRSVPDEAYMRVHSLFDELGEEFGVPIVVLNDGEVSAMAGAMALEDNGVLGLALGSSLAGGYVDLQGNLTDCLNELAFVPIDYHPDAPRDEWSGDLGVGGSYLSQQAVFRLAGKLGVQIPPELSPAGKLTHMQTLLEQRDPRALLIWQTMGNYLGYTLSHYANFYSFRHVLLLGRVTSGSGGEILMKHASQILHAHLPHEAEHLQLHLPDQSSRRVGQAVAAASLSRI